MHWLTSAMCWLLIGTGLVLAPAAQQPQKQLEGTGIATKAERDGKAADDVVGRRLSFTGNRIQIQSKDGKPLYAGTVRVHPGAKPAGPPVSSRILRPPGGLRRCAAAKINHRDLSALGRERRMVQDDAFA